MDYALLYLKFLVLWILVILADFILEFRFEFLWPFYLLLRSVYDSFKYQGLAFSVFFVCIALTSDMLCFFLVPVHWLFFAASTYVWVQYVWYTDRGICVPTITLWMLFVYLEAAVRLKDVKHLPGRIDFCRPFAAHCLGYPAVTLGFGFKSYVGFRMRQKTQRNVAKENEFYLQLMQQALPPGSGNSLNLQESSNTVVVLTQSDSVHSKQCNEKNGHLPNESITNGTFSSNTQKSHRKLSEKLKDDHDYKQIEKCIDRQKINILHPNGVAIGASINETSWIDTEIRSTKRKEKREQDRDKEIFEYLERLEMDSKRLRADLQTSRASEQELRLQITALTSNEKVFKSEQLSLQDTVEELQNKLQSVLSSRTVDRQTISNLERKITEERRYRLGYEAQIGPDRTKNRKEDTKIPVIDYTSRGDCTESCKARKRDLESELQECRTSQCWSEEKIIELERDNSLLLNKVRETDLLKSALESTQEKNINLENNLSAETRIKLDLFSALGEAKRQLEIKDMRNKIQEKEIDELKTKIAQVLAVMPNDSFESPTPLNGKSRVKLTENLSESTLDPNAMAYTPKTNLVNSIITSTEA